MGYVQNSSTDVMESIRAIGPIDELAAKLDAKHGQGWEIWRTTTGEWCFRAGHQKDILNHNSLSGVLLAGLEWSELPCYPRCPWRDHANNYIAKRDGPKWSVYRGQQFIVGNFTSGKKAMQFITDEVARNENAVESWGSQFGPLVHGKTEGVDFKYRD